MPQPTPPPFQSSHEDTTTRLDRQPLPPSADTARMNYQNNPFTIALDGLSGIFRYAKPIGIMFVILSLLGLTGSVASSAYDAMNPAPQPTTETAANPAADLPAEQVIGIIAIVVGIIAVIWLVALLVGTIIKGFVDVAAAAAANKKEITFGQAASQLFRRFPGYLWLQILIGIKTFLWTLLFIIPGIIMSVRYTLAGTAYFARDMKASDALKHSTTITKNNWMTTFASLTLFNLITLGTLSLLVQSGAQSVLFRQLDEYHAANTQTPGAHGLSVAVTVLVWAGVGLSLLMLLAFGGLLATYFISQAA